MINDSFPTIMNFLKMRHGKISDPQLVDWEKELLMFVCDTSEQPDIVFNEVDNYINLCEIIDQPLNDRNKVQLAYCIFQKAGAYRDTMKIWSIQTSDKSYDDFKDFMREEHEEFEEVGALVVLQANMIAIPVNFWACYCMDSLSASIYTHIPIEFLNNGDVDALTCSEFLDI